MVNAIGIGMRYTLIKLSILLGLLALMLSGCGADRPNNIDPAFQDLYDSFIVATQTYGYPLRSNSGITIAFSTLRQDGGNGGIVVGECTAVGFSIPGARINIDSQFWNNSNDVGKTLLVYHELGHCMLNRQHSASQHSIMYPIIDYPAMYYTAEHVAMDTELVVNFGK